MAKKKTSPKAPSQPAHLVTFSTELPMRDHREKRTKDPAQLQLLDGFFDADSMVQYIHNDELGDELGGAKLTGGIVRCEYDTDSQRLLLITDFGSDSKLSKRQLAALKSEVAGQWSDGIGEGAFDDFSRVTGCEVDTCGRSIKVRQEAGARPFTVDAKAKAVVKRLKANWKQAAKLAAPQNDMKALVKCFKAVESKKVGELKKLLASGDVDVNAVCTAKTSDFDRFRLLVVAARRANATIVGVLLDAGADPNLQDEFNFGFAPLHRAGDPAIVRKLLAAGADPNVHTRSFKETPLMFHEVAHKHESVRLLLAAGAKANAKSETTRKCPLLTAVEVNAKSVELLLEAGAKPNLEILHKAVDPSTWDARTTLKERVEIAELLIHAGIKPTPLTLVEAVSDGNPELVRLLHSKGVPLDKTVNANVMGRQTPLTCAIKYRRKETLKVLLELGADPNAGKEQSPLAAAISEGSLPVVKTLLAAGAELKPVVKGESLEATALSKGHKDIASYLAKLLGSESKPGSASEKSAKPGKKKAAPKKAATKKKATTKKGAKKGATVAKRAKVKKQAGVGRRFELSDGKSNKFWEIAVSGSSFTVCYGRIGTAGQTKAKSFADAAACQAEAGKLIRQKTSKGYAEV